MRLQKRDFVKLLLIVVLLYAALQLQVQSFFQPTVSDSIFKSGSGAPQDVEDCARTASRLQARLRIVTEQLADLNRTYRSLQVSTSSPVDVEEDKVEKDGNCKCFTCAEIRCGPPACGSCSVKEDAECKSPMSDGCWTTSESACDCDPTSAPGSVTQILPKSSLVYVDYASQALKLENVSAPMRQKLKACLDLYQAETCGDVVMQAMCQVFAVWEVHHFRYWLSYGTVLHLVRDNELPSDDFDQDFGFPFEELRGSTARDLTQFRRDIQTVGFEFDQYFTTQPLENNKLLEDASLHGCENPAKVLFLDPWDMVFTDSEAVYKPMPCMRYPRHMMETPAIFTIKGYEFSIPSDTQEYLTICYNKWKIKNGDRANLDPRFRDPAYVEANCPVSEQRSIPGLLTGQIQAIRAGT